MNGSNFGRISALLIWSNMWKRSSRILAKNIKLILYRHLAIILPKRRVPSRATVGRWVAQASERAGGILAVLDRACQVGGMLRGVDEIFFHHDPVLVAVEPHSLTWLAGQRGPDRTGEKWCALLEAGPSL